MNRTNSILSLVLVVQIILFGVLFLTNDTAQSSRTAPELLLKGLAVDSVSQLSIANDKETVELTRKSGKWVMPALGDYPADSEKVGQKLGSLLSLESKHIVSQSPEHHMKLEVTQDKFRRKISLKSKEGDKVLWIGGRSAGFTNVRVDKEPKVYAVDELNDWDYGTKARDWMDKKYFELQLDRLAAVEISKPTGVIKLERTDLASWTVSGKTGDKQKIDALVKQLEKIEPSGVVGKVQDAASQKPYKSGEEPISITLALAKEPLPLTPPQAPEAADDSGNKNAQAEIGHTPAPPEITETKVIYMAKNPDKTSMTNLFVEGQTFGVQVDNWRLEKIRSAKLDELVAK